jgi:uncharacterized glyoxalase superfamily protein PhnB
MISRTFPNILSDRVAETRDFYCSLLGFTLRAAPPGVVLTVVVDDVDAVHASAVRRGVPVVAPPRDLFYGQRSCLLVDPKGLLVDVSTPGQMSPEFAASLEERDRVVRQRSG